MNNIDSRNIHAYYYKLLDETKKNKIEDVKPNTFNVISNLAKFS